MKRRSFLKLLLASLTASPLLPGAVSAGASARGAADWWRLARELTQDLLDPRTVGRSYLVSRPGEGKRSRLVASLPPGTRGAAVDVPLLARARTADFTAGRVVEADGWILSSTEARLCALAFLEGRGRR